jgi:hypothetical protein
MFPIGMLLSTVFMALTLVVYGLLPELRNLHGKCLMCHVACLLMAYLSLSIVQLGTNILPEWLCSYLREYHFFLICICVDMWFSLLAIKIDATYFIHTVYLNFGEKEHIKILFFSTQK